MRRSLYRLLGIFLGVTSFLLLTAVVYDAGMTSLEGKPRSFWDSLEWASETLSTTGYGHDNRWSHPLMVLFVITIQFVGIILGPLLVAYYLIPFLSERFEQRLPRRADERLSNHVIVYRFGPAVEMLLERLRKEEIPALVVETDETRARSVLEGGQAVVFVRTEEDVLEGCRLGEARAIVANATDEENAALTLRARQLGFSHDIYAFVQEPAHRRPMELAGATAAYTPRHIVAAALAAHASQKISPRLPGLELVGGLKRLDVRIPPASSASGRQLRDLGFEATVIGQWSASKLQTQCGADMRIEPGAILELVGTEGVLERATQALDGIGLKPEGPFLIAGFGEVGRKVHELLTDAGEEVRVIERQPGPEVDVAGSVLDRSVLDRAGIGEARAIILALNSDDATLFATVIARHADVSIPVIARVNHSGNLDNMHRAGADYALSISDIAGEMLFTRLRGGTARGRDERRRVTSIAATPFAGRRVDETGIRGHGCSIIAIERRGEFVGIRPDLRIEVEDKLWLCGTGEALKRIV